MMKNTYYIMPGRGQSIKSSSNLVYINHMDFSMADMSDIDI